MKIPQGKPWLRHFHGLGDTPIEVDAVIRAPVFDAARLQQHAISLADSHHIGDDGIAHREVKAGLIANEASLAEIRDLLMRAVNNGETITPAGEWLVDNFHIAAQNTHQAIEDLPSGYFRELPKIRDGHLAFRPRVMAIAWAYIAHTDSRVEPERLANFVNAYQTVAHLTIGELWALAIQLRILLIENMARVARRTIESHNARAAAAQVAERFVAEEIDIAGIRLELEKCAEHARLSYFVELNRRIHGKRPINFADLADMMPQLGVDPADVTAAAHEEQARVVANNLTMQNIVTSLKAVGEIDWETWFRRVSVVDAILSRTGIYHQFDKQTRTLYRRSLEDLARYSGKTETEIARLAVEAAAPDDVGAVLIGGSRSIFEHQIAYRAPLHRLFGTVVKRAGLAGYLTASALLAFAIAAIAVAAHEASSFTAPGLLAFFLLILPLAFDAALAMVNYGITQLMRPVILPALDFENGVPDEHQTIIAMPVLITSFHGVDQSLERLEGHFISNPDANLFYAIVSDWMDAPSENMADDQSLLDRLKRGVEALNQKHGHDRIMVFHRARKWNASQKTWMGWERKRGKLHELNQLLRCAENTSFVSVPAQVPRGVRYVIVLDADTLLPRGAAAHLIGKIAHPLNQPVFDPAEGRVTRGYGILQPRVATLLPERNSGSIYHNLSVSRPGLDPYVFASSDVYQDLFGEGTFTGKGLYDIDAFEASVAGRVQENTLLSHDLFEGNFARAALASDVEVAEDFPERYLVDMARHHRWTRGDWQLLPWMFPPTRGLTALGWWKMFDNLRRSLMPALTFLSLVLGWGMLPAADAATWTTTVLTVLFMPAFLPVFAGSSMRREPITLSSEIHSFLDDLVHALRLTASRLTFLAHQASVMVDAIARTLYRLMVSRSHFLEWTTAAQLQTSLNPSLNGTYRLMWISATAGLVIVLIGTVHGGALAIAGIPFGVLWMIAPAIAYFISTARRDESDAELTRDEIAELRQIALKTWRFFDVHVVERENMLPPDNLQEIPVPVIANRTSPTNIGLYMLSAVSAHEMGWIGLDEAANRLRATLDTVGRMRRFRGHLINWYDTQTLAPLEPQYVSTVDSGNLAAHLIAVANACDTWRLSSTTNTARLNGLVDLATALREIIGESISSHRDAKPAAAELTLEIDGLISTLNTLRDEPQFIALRLVSILAQIKRQTVLLRVLWEKVGFAGQANGLYWADRLDRAAEAMLAEATRDRSGHAALSAQLEQIASQCRTIAHEMNFGFLLNRKRGLLSIGYRVSDETLDDSCYDMLASEAALTNFLAIATSDANVKLWSRLGRPIVAVNNRACLLSWSGSMFEYLMPLLVMHVPEGTLYRQTMALAIQRQRTYAARKNIPWGISESAYAGRDRHFTYQYSSFGVPGLGLKRGLANDLVVAPYATGLAAMLAPAQAIRNYRRLAALGALGQYGFYESVDFTKARLRPNESYEVIRAYFAHHQGMTITAIHNAVSGGALRNYFHRENSVRAAELLLQERAPTYLPTKTMAFSPEVAAGRRTSGDAFVARIIEPRNTATPQVNLLSNGNISVMLTADGRGYTCWKGIAVGRWREDRLRGEGGMTIMLREPRTGHLWPAVAWETGENPPELAIFSQEKAEFKRTDHGIATRVECLVSSEQDVEGRVVELVNLGDRHRRIEITSYMELALAPPDADESHPAFSKLFIHTEFDEERRALLATRRRRLDSDPDIWAAQFIVDVTGAGKVSAAEFDTSREAFLERGNDLRTSAAMRDSKPLSASVGDVLDSVFALRHVVDLQPHKKCRVIVWTAVAASKAAVLDIVSNHRSPSTVDRVQVNAWTQSRVLLHHLSLDVTRANLFQDLAGALIYAGGAYRPDAAAIAATLRPQFMLWSLSISGVRPIVALKISRELGIGLVETILKAQDYWAEKGLAVDVVIINTQPASYAQELQSLLDRLVARERTNRAASGVEGGEIFLVKADTVDNGLIDAIFAAARITLEADGGALAEKIAAPIPSRRELPSTSILNPEKAGTPTQVPDLAFFNGYGGFDLETNEYVVVHRADTRLPAPWINVIANESFGTHCSAEGGGYTWFNNSKEQQITCWSNDPLIDRPSEVVYILDRQSRLLHCPTVDPLGPRAGQFRTRHGFGYTSYEAREGDLDLELTVTIDPEDPVKRSRLRITNRTSRERRLLVTYYAEVAMAQSRRVGAPYVVSTWDEASGTLMLRNPWNSDFGETTVFAGMGEQTLSWSADRNDVLGSGLLKAPPNIASGLALGRKAGGGLDPCIGLQREIVLDPRQSEEIWITLGAALSPQAAREQSRKYWGVPFAATLEAQRQQWSSMLSAVTVKSPDPAFNVMLNGWLLYQATSCRFWGRSGFYQASGAFGFRDQLQDSMAVAHVRPDLARRHILVAASRQFIEGDVQHWWLPGTGAGVRTHISDDTSWLAYCTAYFVRLTGDTSILDEEVPFLEGELLPKEIHDRFFVPDVGTQRASLYEHCVRGLNHALRMGPHGLPLMGTGDWNDGMNQVGEKGTGESIWLGWLLCATLEAFEAIAEARGDGEVARSWNTQRQAMARALNTAGWDGSWFRRAYFDDQTPLGTALGAECRIDTIAQSWAVISDAADPDKAAQALASAHEMLIDRENAIAHLFLPPLQHHQPSAGYIQSYPPGVRENGGQYTHGALWSIFAHAKLRQTDKAFAIYSLINPVNHALTEEAAKRYRIEPYVIAADVYSHGTYKGRGGWSWYTGAAGWAYRAGLEAVLGINRQGNRLFIQPCLPPEWPSCSVDYRYADKTITLVYQRQPSTPAGREISPVIVELGSVKDGEQVIVPVQAAGLEATAGRKSRKKD